MKALITSSIDEERKLALWPSYFTFEKLMKIRRELGSVIFGLQYQNDARLALGSIFKPDWFQFMTMDEFLNKVDILKGAQGMDLAISTKETADYTAHVTGVTDGPRFYITDCEMARLTFGQQLGIAQRNFYRDRDLYRINMVGIEDVAYQRALVQYLDEISNLPLKGIKVTKDKVSRFMPMAGLFEAGKVWFVVRPGSTWHIDLQSQMLMFDGTGSGNDDGIDALWIVLSILWTGFTPQYFRIRGV